MRLACCLLAASIAVIPVGSYAQGPITPHHFTAQWITAADAPGHDPAVLRLHKELVLAAVPAHFVVHVSADNQFLLFVNGKRVGQGPAIGDVQHWRYETYDLAPLLHSGRNVLAATVWNLGDVAPIRQMSSRLGFVVDPDTAAAGTNSSWLARRDMGFSFLPKPAETGGAYYVASPGERLDAGLMQWDWSEPEVKAAGPEWHPAVSVGGAVERGVHSESNSWLLVPDLLPAMESAPTGAGRVVRADGPCGDAAVSGGSGGGCGEQPCHAAARSGDVDDGVSEPDGVVRQGRAGDGAVRGGAG